MTALAILLGLAIGVIFGAVGGGGAILALPVLVYVLGEPVGPASTASLVVVSLAAAVGAGALARHGRVCWNLALTFAGPAAAGALLGTLASREVDARTLVLAFVPVMVLAAVGHVAAHGARRRGRRRARSRRWHGSSCAGLLVGALTGFFGVGGGFVIVPVLTLWLGAPFRRAVATSLVIIAITGVAALVSHLLTGARPDLAITLALACAIGLGALGGTAVAERVPAAVLGRAFALLVARRRRLAARRRARARRPADLMSSRRERLLAGGMQAAVRRRPDGEPQVIPERRRQPRDEHAEDDPLHGAITGPPPVGPHGAGGVWRNRRRAVRLLGQRLHRLGLVRTAVAVDRLPLRHAVRQRARAVRRRRSLPQGSPPGAHLPTRPPQALNQAASSCSGENSCAPQGVASSV